MTYRAMQFSAGKYWSVGTFKTLADALKRAAEFGYKSKVQEWRNGAWRNIKLTTEKE